MRVQPHIRFTLLFYYYYYYYYYYHHHHHHHCHHYGKRQDTIVGKVIRLRAGLSGVLLVAATREFFFISLPIQCGSAMELTTHLCLVSRLKVSGAVCLPRLYAFMAFTGAALSVFF